MNILAIGDLHLRKSKPAMRVDDFLAEQNRKLEYILTLAREEHCEAIVMPGDVFDKSDAPHGLVESTIRKLQGQPYQYLFVYGQHDLRYHTRDKQNTPLGVVIAALGNKAHVLSNKPFQLENAPTVHFYGVSWGEELPTQVDTHKTNILVIHRPITMDPLPWSHADLLTAQELIDACPMNLFITGDNHTFFKLETDKAKLVNLGSVMRTSIAQIEHKPQVAKITIQGEKIKIRLFQVPVRHFVFDEELAQEKQANEERLAAFIDGLQREYNPELCFIDNLRVTAQAASRGVQEIINTVLAQS